MAGSLPLSAIKSCSPECVDIKSGIDVNETKEVLIKRVDRKTLGDEQVC